MKSETAPLSSKTQNLNSEQSVDGITVLSLLGMSHEAIPDKTFKKDVLGESHSALSTPSLAKDNVLKTLLEVIKPIDFHKILGSPADTQISERQYRVLIIRELLRIAKVHNWALCRKNDMTYVYNGAFWTMLDHGDMKLFLGKVASSMGIGLLWAEDYAFKDALLKQFESASHMQNTEPDNSIVLINLMNGTFVFVDGACKLKAFDQKDFMTYQLPFAYEPKVEAPLFRSYLDRVLPDRQRQRVLAEYCAYIFTKNLKLSKALFLYGTGANGKSVFFDILSSMLGESNCSNFSLSSLANANTQGQYSRAKMQNMLVNYSSEISGTMDIGLFKQLVSGEAVEARHPYGKPFILTSYAKFIFNGNELPKSVEHTHAFFRRFKIIPFEETIPEEEQDKYLAEKIIKNELAGVFNWVLEGLERLLSQDGFSPCDACDKMLATCRIIPQDKITRIAA